MEVWSFMRTLTSPVVSSCGLFVPVDGSAAGSACIHLSYSDSCLCLAGFVILH